MAISYRTTTYPCGTYHTGERNDCSVRALMTAVGCTYTAAHATLASIGRQHRKGVMTYSLKRLLDSGEALHGHTFTRVHDTSWGTTWTGRSWRASRMGTISLARFAAANPVGTFYVLKSGHAFAMVDGVVVDTWKPGARCKVTAAWRVEPVAVPAPAAAPVQAVADRTGRKVSPATLRKLQAALQGAGDTVVLTAAQLADAGLGAQWVKASAAHSRWTDGGLYRVAVQALGYELVSVERGTSLTLRRAA
jgi:hypothetical protein